MTGLALLLEQAIAQAITCHRGQVDKAGRPYILHPLRVMLSFTEPEDDETRIAAVLHDVVEDSDITIDILRNCGYPLASLSAIDALTKRPEETYDVYLNRVAGNPMARRVKIADLRDNLDPTRSQWLTNSMWDRYVKALKALRRLTP